MTTREFIEMAGRHWLVLVGLFAALPAGAGLCGRAHGRGNGGNAPWKYLYSVLVYLACVPGLFAGVVTAYALFFSRENLLDVNPLAYFLPVLSMVVTLVLVRKNVAFDQIPGFDRLSGLMVMIGCSFAIALVIQKTNVWILFGGSIDHLLILAAGVFALLKWGTYAFFRNRDEPRKEAPEFPSPGGGSL